MAHIFLDESGQFTKDGDSRYFVIASFTVGDPRRTEKQFRAWQRAKFPRKMRNQPEIKFSAVDIDDTLRLATVRFISELDVRIRYSYLDRHNIPEDYRHKSSIRSGELYTAVVGETVADYAPSIDKELRIFCDQRHLKRVTRAMFRDKLTARLLPTMPTGSVIQVEMVDSTTSANIQVADWIVGALARFLNSKRLGEDFHSLLKGNIVGGKELFKDSWTARILTHKKPDA
ncbi:DUF3800 domain-containing protein [Patescibacteria group bacterium]|nr:DUF3800 domain-containing protein [Patescibacteria group bacterium]